MNHSRCCANDSGNSASRLTATTGGASTRSPLALCRSTSSAIASTVGRSNNCRNPNSTPSASLTRLTTCVASNECPPNSKKFSSLPTRSILSTSAHIPPMISSTGVCLSSLSPLPSSSSSSTSGNPRRSNFPFAVTGSLSITTTCLGTMYSGSRLPASSLILFLSASFPSSISTYATNLFLSSLSPLISTTHCLTPSISFITHSTSPSSTRYPLTFTCRSPLPSYINSPPLSLLTSSPVRYTRLPSSSPYSSGTYLSAVCLASFRYPRPTPSPPMYNSPRPRFTSASPAPFITYALTFPSGRPIATRSASLLSTSCATAPTVHSVGP